MTRDKFLDELDAGRLEDLRDQWGELFTIVHVPDAPWSALPKRGPSVAALVADSAEELRRMIWHAYQGMDK